MMHRLKKILSAQSDVVKHGAVYLSSRVGTKIFGFLMLPVWTQFLSPSEYGVIGVVSAYVGMSAPLLLLGVPSAIVRQYHDYRDVWSGYLKTMFLYLLGAVVLVYLGMWLWHFIGGEGAPKMVNEYRGVFWVALTGGAATQLAVAGLQAESLSRQFIIGNFVSYFAGLALSLILVVGLGMGAKGFLYGMGSGCFVGVGYIIFSRRRSWLIHGQYPKPEYLNKALRYGYVLVPAAVAGWGVNFSSRLVVERFHSLHEVGLFSFAGNIAMIVSFVMVSLSQAWVPAYYAARKSEDSELLKREHNQIEQLVLYVGGAVLIGLSTVGVLLISTIVSSKYIPAMPLVLPLGVGFVFYGLVNVETRGFMFSGKNIKVSGLYVLAALLTVCLALLMVPQWGAYGASLASMFALISVLIVTLFVTRKDNEGVLGNFIVAFFAVLSGVCWLIDRELPSSGVAGWGWRLFVCLVLLGCLYGVGHNKYKKNEIAEV